MRAGRFPGNVGLMMYSSAQQPGAMVDLHAEKRRDLPRREVTIDDVVVKYARSGGPGGQNVNKLVSRRQASSRHYHVNRVGKTSLKLCGHAEHKSRYAVQHHRGGIFARLGQGTLV